MPREAVAGPWTRYPLPFAVFLALVLGHWVEHVVQLAQVHVLDWRRGDAHGVLGSIWPWLATSESLHFFYALGMLVGLIAFLPTVSGAARPWWIAAVSIQAFHQFEHALLVTQAWTGHNLAGSPIRTSVMQLAFDAPRIEVHFVYNALATTAMVLSVVWMLIEAPRRGVRPLRRS